MTSFMAVSRTGKKSGVECDDDALYDIIHDGVTWEEVNKCDKSGRVSSLSAVFMYSVTVVNPPSVLARTLLS